MLNINEIEEEVIQQALEVDFILGAEFYETEEAARREGFYWYEEIEAWVNVEKVKELI